MFFLKKKKTKQKTLDEVSNGFDQECSKELKNQFDFSEDHGCEVTVNNMGENQQFPYFDPEINNHLIQ